MHNRRRLIFGMTLLLLKNSACHCDEAVKKTDDNSKSEVAKVAKAFVADVRVSSNETTLEDFEVQTQPILRWSNPTAGRVFGEVFLWTHHGRPAVAASYYRWFSPDWGDTFEVTSLHAGPVVAQCENVRFWNSRQAGVAIQSLSDGPVPASTAAARLTQMRRIAQEFTAELSDTRGVSDEVERHLRLLNQPVYRYAVPTEKSDYIDGALFAFVEGTDPEVFLTVELLPESSSTRWQFGLTRMNRDALQILYKDKVVWTAPYLKEWDGRWKEPYAVYAMRQPLPSVP